MDKKLVSIIIPCYNEEEALDIVYEAIMKEMIETMNINELRRVI